MAKVTRSTLKSYFNTGDQPTESEFIDVFDSTLNLSGSNAITGSLIISGSTKDTADGLPVVLRVHGNIIADQYIVSSSVTEITTQTISGSTEFGNTVDDTHDFTGDITASRHISASGTITADSMTAVSASFLHITASTVDVDANTIVIGGTPFNKGDVDNLKLGRPLTLDTAVEGFDSIIRPAAIMSQLNSDDYQKWTVEGRLGTVIGGALIHDIKNDGDVSSISLGKADASTRVSVTGSLEISGSSTLTNWGNFRNRLHQDRFAFEVSTNPFAAGGFKQHQTPTGNAYTGSAPHLHFMLSGSGQTGVGLLNPEHTLHVSASSNTFQALYVDGDSTFIGNISASGTINISDTITLGQFAHIKGHITASDTFSQFGNPINSNISASGTLFGQFANIKGHITASGNISASGTGSFGRLEGMTGGVLNITTGIFGTNTTTINDDVHTTGHITASGNISASGTLFGRFAHINGHITASDTFSQFGNPINSNISASGTLFGQFANITGHITASGNISASGTIIASQLTGSLSGNATGLSGTPSITVNQIIAATISSSGKITGLTGSFGRLEGLSPITVGSNITASGNISASGTITANAFVGNITGDLTGEADTVATIAGLAPNTATTQATQGNITSLGTLTGLNVNGQIIASGNISSSGTITGNSIVGTIGTATQGTIDHDSLANFVANEHIDHSGVSITAGAGLTGGGTIASTRDIAVGAGVGVTVNADDVAIGQDVATTANVLFNHITASGNISASGVLTGASLSLPSITSAAATDALFYIINGKRVEVRSQTQVGIAADTGWTLELRNTSIEPNSLIVANVIGGEGGILTGSVVTANVIAANTASLNFFNTGLAIVDNATFTASLAIF